MALPGGFFGGRMNIEGLNATRWVIMREDLCQWIESEVSINQRMLICGPAGSGKTSLAQLLRERAKAAGQQAFVIELRFNKDKWEDIWIQQTGTSWQEITLSKEPVVVIIDEVQFSYPSDAGLHSLWSEVQRLLDSDSPISFICAGMYTPNQDEIPVKFPVVVSHKATPNAPGLEYTKDEFIEICREFTLKTNIQLEESSINYIYAETSGHPGIVEWIFSTTYRYFHNDPAEASASRLAEYLPDLLAIPFCRAVPLSENICLAEAICRRVLQQYSTSKSEFIGVEIIQLQEAIKASVVIENDGFIMFAAPLIQHRAMELLRVVANKPSMHEFILDVMRYIATKYDPTKVRDWQCRARIAATSILPRDVFLAVYGDEFGQDQADLYVEAYKWLIEILQDGTDLEAHEARFKPGGMYKRLPIDEGAVVDFRSAKEAETSKPNSTYFCYNSDFTSILVTKGNEQATYRI